MRDKMTVNMNIKGDRRMREIIRVRVTVQLLSALRDRHHSSLIMVRRHMFSMIFLVLACANVCLNIGY